MPEGSFHLCSTLTPISTFAPAARASDSHGSFCLRRRLATIVGVIGVVLGIGVSARQSQPPAAQRPDHLEHRFDDPERYAKEFDDPARDAWQMPDRVIATLGLKAAQSVADIGAGTGYFSIRLAKSPASPMVYAVDIEPSMVKYLKSRAAKEGLKNVVPVQASADSPHLPAPVDLALVVDTYHHIADRVEYFGKLRASLKSGGRLVIIDFREDAPTGPPPEFRFTEAQITSELTQAGYGLAGDYSFLPRQLFMVYEPK